MKLKVQGSKLEAQGVGLKAEPQSSRLSSAADRKEGRTHRKRNEMFTAELQRTLRKNI
jgi:hypothetical protein